MLAWADKKNTECVTVRSAVRANRKLYGRERQDGTVDE